MDSGKLTHSTFLEKVLFGELRFQARQNRVPLSAWTWLSVLRNMPIGLPLSQKRLQIVFQDRRIIETGFLRAKQERGISMPDFGDKCLYRTGIAL